MTSEAHALETAATTGRRETLSGATKPRVAMAGNVRPCPFCGTLEAVEVLETDRSTPDGEPYRVVACAQCGLCYTRPFPSPEELDATYSDSYINYHSVLASRERKPWQQRVVDGCTSLFARSLLWDRRRALLRRRPGRVLDVGCGNGDFLATLRRRGWEVYGTEFSSAASEMARARGVAVHQGDLASAGFPDRYFDVVTFWHVVEHLEHPLEDLAEARRILRDDGLLIVEVPNIASPTFRLCGENWFLLEVPQHVQHFTPSTLVQMLRAVGMTPVYRQNVRCWNVLPDFYSFLNALGIRERLGIRHFSTDFGRAGAGSKALFLALGVPLAGFSLAYSMFATLLSGNGPILTVSARKATTAA